MITHATEQSQLLPPFARIRPPKGRFVEPQTVGKKCIQGSSFDTSDSVSSWDWGARVDLDWSIQVTLEMPSLPLVKWFLLHPYMNFPRIWGLVLTCMFAHFIFLRSCFPILSLFPTSISLFESLTCFPMIFTFCSAVLSFCKGLTPTCCNCPQLLQELVCWRTEWTTSLSNLSPLVPEIVSSTFSENPSFYTPQCLCVLSVQYPFVPNFRMCVRSFPNFTKFSPYYPLVI